MSFRDQFTTFDEWFSKNFDDCMSEDQIKTLCQKAWDFTIKNRVLPSSFGNAKEYIDEVMKNG